MRRRDMTDFCGRGILFPMPRPIRAIIHSPALAHNLAVAQKHAGAAKIWAVLKANAYGHGLLRAAEAMKEADGFAVLDFVDALKLRNAGIDKPILMLEGFFKPEDLPVLSRYNLTPVIHNVPQLEMLEKVTFVGNGVTAELDESIANPVTTTD